MSEDNIIIKMTMLTGTVSIAPPRYRVEPQLDLCGRVIYWWLRCDIGVDIGGYESREEAVLMAHMAGVRAANA